MHFEWTARAVVVIYGCRRFVSNFRTERVSMWSLESVCLFVTWKFSKQRITRRRDIARAIFKVLLHF